MIQVQYPKVREPAQLRRNVADELMTAQRQTPQIREAAQLRGYAVEVAEQVQRPQVRKPSERLGYDSASIQFQMLQTSAACPALAGLVSQGMNRKRRTALMYATRPGRPAPVESCP